MKFAARHCLVVAATLCACSASSETSCQEDNVLLSKDGKDSRCNADSHQEGDIENVIASDEIAKELREWVQQGFVQSASNQQPKSSAIKSACYAPGDVKAIFSVSPKPGGESVTSSNQKKDGDDDTAKKGDNEEVEETPRVRQDRTSNGVLLKKLEELNGKGIVVFKDGSEIRSDHFSGGYVKPGSNFTLYPNFKDITKLVALTGDSNGGSCLHGRVLGLGREVHPVYLANFEHGVPTGPQWFKVMSIYDNVLVGTLYVDAPADYGDREKINLDLRRHNMPFFFNGSDVAFIYPDFTTTLLGRWREGVMEEARQVHITSISTDPSGMKRESFSQPFGPVFRRDVSTNAVLSNDPMLRDPYEAKTVEVRESSIEGAGQGVFLKRFVPADTIVSYFNGVRLRERDVFAMEEKSVYVVEIGEDDEYLDVPKDMAIWENYQASAGHKINHDREAAGDYADCDHPRFGRILCYIVKKDLPAGTELFNRYDVNFDKTQMKDILKAALSVGHFFSGKTRGDFVKEVKPLLHMASKMAGNIKVDDYLKF